MPAIICYWNSSYLGECVVGLRGRRSWGRASGGETFKGFSPTPPLPMFAVKSAIRFHLETFGDEVLPDDSPLLEAFVAEATIPA